MKKYLYVLFAALCINYSTHAAPGDTTWVQATIAQLGGYGNYDSTVTFPAPGITYRKVYMIFTLGKYVCPGTPTYCGDWDYTVLNYLMTPGGDTLELGRLITPYANAGAPRTPWAWQQHYVFDVTDYQSLLHNTATMRTLFSGYSGGFTEDLKFAFIEGTPDRNVVGVKRLWTGSYGYGGTPDINSHFPAVSVTAPTGTVTADMKFLVTGHGSDANYCCEFMSHNYQVMLNSTSVATKAIWRADCGLNELFPQSGTWIYDRANWCPGALVHANFHTLPGITAGSAFNTSLLFDPYTGGGSYTTEAQVIYYGGYNKTLDASLDQIISPTVDENHWRENPIVGSPIVHVKNTGATAITSMSFLYGIKDSMLRTYDWSGSLSSLQEADITLPSLHQLNSVTGTSGSYTFVANITAVNGTTDADSTNNHMTTQFIAAPRWDSSFKILFRTNNEAISTGSTICETSWYIYDMNNTIVAQHSGATINTLYTDTVTLPGGMYRFQLYDSSCDGLHWWVNDQPGSTINAGYMYVKKFNNANIPMHGYNYGGTYANDFGCGFSQYFYVYKWEDYTGIKNVVEGDMNMEAYPNPSQGIVNVDFAGIPQVNGVIRVMDVMGRIVSETNCLGAHQQIDLANVANGVYTIVFVDALNPNKKLTSRILIAK